MCAQHVNSDQTEPIRLVEKFAGITAFPNIPKKRHRIFRLCDSRRFICSSDTFPNSPLHLKHRPKMKRSRQQIETATRGISIKTPAVQKAFTKLPLAISVEEYVCNVL